MKVIEPYVEIEAGELDRKKLSQSERAAETRYRTEFKNDPDFIQRLKPVIERERITVRVICDRGINHEIVRHRIGDCIAESTCYSSCSRERIGSEITVIRPCSLVRGGEIYRLWVNECRASEDAYMLLLASGLNPDTAGSVLPAALKTEIAVTCNLREWRHLLKLCADKAAHPQIRQLAIPVLLQFREVYPELFKDISFDESFNPDDYAQVRILG